MVDYFRTLKTIVKSPRLKVSDTGWLETLPQNDHLAAQDVVLERLNDFLSEDCRLDQSALDALMSIDQHCADSVAKLTEQYVHAPVLPKEIDERLWQSVHDYYAALISAYQRFLDHSLRDASGLPHDLPQLLLNLVDCRRCLAKWRYFRYLPMMEGGWSQLHQLYRLAESHGCPTMLLWRHRNQGETTLLSVYLQTLMLDTLPHTDLLKHEIEMVAGWLAEWCGVLTLSDAYNVSRHLFYVDLSEDKGGRHARRVHPSPSCRYWDTDEVVARITRAHVELQHGKSPTDLHLSAGMRLADCQPLLEYLLKEWSRTSYQRQRRAVARKAVNWSAYVVYGMENVCQHVKNVAFALSKGRAENGLAAFDVLSRPEGGGGEIAILPGMSAEKWTFQNESEFGFGAVVDTAQNQWLHPGKLVAFKSEKNLRFPLVGVVRNIKHAHGNKRHVGVEVLSRAPVHVMLRSLSDGVRAQKPPAADVFLAATLTAEGPSPFSAIYLPRDDVRNLPSRLLVPALEYVAGGEFELWAEHQLYQVRLDLVVEHMDDWVCVIARVVEKNAAL